MKYLLALLILFPAIAPAQVSEAEQLAEQYKEIKDDLVRDEEERRRVLSDLYKVTHFIKKIQRRRDDFIFERNQLTSKIKQAGEKIEELKQRLVEGRKQISQRLRSLYKFNGQASLRVLFTSQSISELDRNTRVLKLILNRDVSMFEGHKKSIKAYVIQKVQLKRNLARLGSVERAIETQEDALITQQETKSRILARFDEATVMRLKDLENIRTMSSARGTGLTAAFFEKKGKLPTPVIGRLRQRFGILKDKASEAKLRYKGHYYEAPIGETVKAVHSGEIAFSGDVVGYGATVVISHGDHYYSVYGGLRKIDVEEGDRVSVDDPVGTSGDSYYLFSSGLYFEIRHFSDPVNPAEWLADSGRQITFVQEDQ